MLSLAVYITDVFNAIRNKNLLVVFDALKV